jgi:hypothetical protein
MGIRGHRLTGISVSVLSSTNFFTGISVSVLIPVPATTGIGTDTESVKVPVPLKVPVPVKVPKSIKVPKLVQVPVLLPIRYLKFHLCGYGYTDRIQFQYDSIRIRL